MARREAEEIAEEYSLASNRFRMEALRRRLQDAGIDLQDPMNHQIYDSTTLLHWNHLRPAPSGSWKTEASPAERALLGRLCDPWLLENGYEPTVEPGVMGLSSDDRDIRPTFERDVAIGRIVFAKGRGRSISSRRPPAQATDRISGPKPRRGDRLAGRVRSFVVKWAVVPRFGIEVARPRRSVRLK